MSRYIIDIHGDIEGDYDIIGKYVEPTADVRVKGEWIPIGEPDKDNNQQVECSNCHAGDLHAVGVEVPYCWKCGADMRGEV